MTTYTDAKQTAEAITNRALKAVAATAPRRERELPGAAQQIDAARIAIACVADTLLSCPAPHLQDVLAALLAGNVTQSDRDQGVNPWRATHTGR